MRKFLVPLAADKYGNTAYHKAVFEVEETPDGVVHVVAPTLELMRHTTLSTHWPWMETVGPARKLTHEEWTALTGWKP